MLAGGCTETVPAAEPVRDDSVAVAMVEAAQDAKPPPVPLELQPITAADIERHDLYGAGCNLEPGLAPGEDPVIIANGQRAFAKVAGRLIIFAADPGSPELELGARAHYVGKAQSLFLHRKAGEGTKLGEETLRWTGRAEIRDVHDRPVHIVSGQLVCGS